MNAPKMTPTEGHVNTPEPEELALDYTTQKTPGPDTDDPLATIIPFRKSA